MINHRIDGMLLASFQIWSTPVAYEELAGAHLR